MNRTHRTRRITTTSRWRNGISGLGLAGALCMGAAALPDTAQAQSLIENTTATARTTANPPDDFNGNPMRAVDRSGFDAATGAHATGTWPHSWVSADQGRSTGLDEWFKVDLGGRYDLSEVVIYNGNEPGYGLLPLRRIVQADLYVSDEEAPGEVPTNNADGNGWTLVQADAVFTQASGRADYGANPSFAMPDQFDVSGHTARHVALKFDSQGGRDQWGVHYVQIAEFLVYGEAAPEGPVEQPGAWAPVGDGQTVGGYVMPYAYDEDTVVFGGQGAAHNAVLFVSTDGGETATGHNPPGAAGMYATHSPDGQNFFSVGAGGVNTKSIDGGATWTTMGRTPGHMHGGVHFFDENVGVTMTYTACYKAPNSTTGIYRTTDGGGSWQKVQGGMGACGFTKPSAFGDTVIWGAGNTIWRSDDRGATWRSIPIAGAGPSTVNSASFTSPDVGYVVGGNGFVSKTTDGGQTWTQLANPAPRHLYGVDFATADIGWITGHDVLLHTTDGGLTWEDQSAAVGVPGTYATAIEVLCADVAFFGTMHNGQLYKWTAGDGRCDGDEGEPQGPVDSDGDGVPDENDAFPHDPTESVDTDGDGIGDGADPCTGLSNVDSDGDTVCDENDVCPTDPVDADEDGDGVCDVVDICIGLVNIDSDGDQICDDRDLCLGNDATGDTDADGLCDANDNCPSDSNPEQTDFDGDLIGDVCDADADGDGTDDDIDTCPGLPNPDQADSDADGLGDACDDDDDDDGVDDAADNCPLIANGDQVDFDGDGQGDACDGDDDADGVADLDDLCPGTPMNVVFDPATGCSGIQWVENQAPCVGDWQNKGQYQSAVTAAANSARDNGLLTHRERAAIVRQAAKSSCGR